MTMVMAMAMTVMARPMAAMTLELRRVATPGRTPVAMPRRRVAPMPLAIQLPQPVVPMQPPTHRRRLRRFAPEGRLQGLPAQPLETTLVTLAPVLLAPMSRRSRVW